MMEYRVIKENNVFLISDEKGNLTPNHPYGLGLYYKDTRYLSKWDLKINGKEPILLSSEEGENDEATILLTNPPIEKEGVLQLWRESVEIERKRFIFAGVLYEVIGVKNYFPQKVEFEISVHMDVDFADMFIVRGFQDGKVGQRTGQCLEEKERNLQFGYQGEDQLKRTTFVTWDKQHEHVTSDGDITFHFSLNHLENDQVVFKLIPHQENDEAPEALDYAEALRRAQKANLDWKKNTTRVQTDYEPLQKLVEKGIADLKVLLTDVGQGPFPVAGLPWFAVPFGRDSLITALQMLSFNPEIAKGTLQTMASQQGAKYDPWRDEQPGKIMHEMRFGELANTNQVPFTPYYGSIDSTPLFLLLLVEYVKWTGNLSFVREMEPHITAALTWIDQYGDSDGDQLVEYRRESSKGIANQGWKDSDDSIVHRNGKYAEAPIALAEVQGYVYQAKEGLSKIYEHLGNIERANTLRDQALKLKERFEEAFWMEDVHYYAIALDKNKEQVGTITSNPGHILFSGIAAQDRADAVVRTLTSAKMFSGFGIRTMGANEAGYNPMSYHDGSVWPHDNSVILLGMSKQGKQEEAKKIMSGLITAASYFEYSRLPELFCGYDSSLGKVVKYPVACSPQAWAAGTPLVFVQALLGIFPNSLEKKISLSPTLLDDMKELKVENMSMGEGILSLIVRRKENEYVISVEQNTTGYTLVLV